MKQDRVVFDAKVSEKKILLIPIETVVVTPYNPKARTAEGVKLKRLTDSIRKHGLIQPLIITSDRDLVDGNRRLAAAKLVGLPLVECIVLPDGVNKDEVFGEVNTTAEKIGGRGWLEACRKGYKTPPKTIKAQYDELFGLIGSYGVDLLIRNKLGLNILQLCKDVRSIGLPIRLDEMLMKVASRKLTNRINAIRRSSDEVDHKVKSLMELLA